MHDGEIFPDSTRQSHEGSEICELWPHARSIASNESNGAVHIMSLRYFPTGNEAGIFDSVLGTHSRDS